MDAPTRAPASSVVFDVSAETTPLTYIPGVSFFTVYSVIWSSQPEERTSISNAALHSKAKKTKVFDVLSSLNFGVIGWSLCVSATVGLVGPYVGKRGSTVIKPVNERMRELGVTTQTCAQSVGIILRFDASRWSGSAFSNPLPEQRGRVLEIESRATTYRHRNCGE